jgi:hypothetical protein
MYFDPVNEASVQGHLDAHSIDELMSAILELSSERGHPALELVRDDGSTLSVGTNGQLAALVWVNSLGDSFHSRGGSAGDVLVYDYFGSWTEAPGSSQVALPDAVECVREFVRCGAPDTDCVLFVPD